MTAFAVTVPKGFRVVEAEPVDGWVADVRGRTATWRGASLEPEEEGTFTLDIEAPAATGVIELQAMQRYPGGAVVTWPVALTVIPGTVQTLEASRRLPVVALVGVGLLASVLMVLLVRRTRRRSLQER